MTNMAKKQIMQTLLQGGKRAKWLHALSNFGLFSQGNEYSVLYTDTIKFILYSKVLEGQEVTYDTFVFDRRPPER